MNWFVLCGLRIRLEKTRFAHWIPPLRFPLTSSFWVFSASAWHKRPWTVSFPRLNRQIDFSPHHNSDNCDLCDILTILIRAVVSVSKKIQFKVLGCTSDTWRFPQRTINPGLSDSNNGDIWTLHVLVTAALCFICCSVCHLKWIFIATIASTLRTCIFCSCQLQVLLCMKPKCENYREN